MFIFIHIIDICDCTTRPDWPDPNAFSTLIYISETTKRTKKIYLTKKLDSRLKIYVLKFQIGINDTFGVIRISVKAIFSIFSEVFRAYLAIQWDF